MIPNPYPGKFFVFEGIDGCGKTEQLTRTASSLRSISSHYVTVVKEPGKERFLGIKIYDDLAKPDGLHVQNPYGFQSWYACDSKQNLRENIIPSLRVGNIVLSDRFRPSLVYGVGRFDSIDGLETEIERFMRLNQAIIGEDFIWPDAILIFDVSVKTALQRLKQKFEKQGKGNFDGYEQEHILARIRKNYLLFARTYPNCHIIHGEQTPEKIFEDVQQIISPIMKSLKKIV